MQDSPLFSTRCVRPCIHAPRVFHVDHAVQVSLCFSTSSAFFLSLELGWENVGQKKRGKEEEKTANDAASTSPHHWPWKAGRKRRCSATAASSSSQAKASNVPADTEAVRSHAGEAKANPVRDGRNGTHASEASRAGPPAAKCRTYPSWLSHSHATSAPRLKSETEGSRASEKGSRDAREALPLHLTVCQTSQPASSSSSIHHHHRAKPALQ
jgi:hypothetical protein